MESERNLISVIISAHKHELYVVDAITSVIHQTHQNWEIILITYESIDQTVSSAVTYIENLDEAIRKKIRVLIYERMDQYSILNLAVNSAKGRTIAILNGNDYFFVNRLEKLNEVLQQEGKEIAFSYIHFLEECKQRMKGRSPTEDQYETNIYDNLVASPSVSFSLFSSDLFLTDSNLFFTRKIFDEIGPFRNYEQAYRLDFLLRAVELTEPVLVQEPLLYYREQTGTDCEATNQSRKNESASIYRGYFHRTSIKMPENELAPSFQKWPQLFSVLIRQVNERYKNLKIFDRIALNKVGVDKNLIVYNGDSKKSKSKKKFTIVAHELSNTGAPRLAFDLALSLRARGHKVNFIALNPGPLESEVRKSKLSLIVMPRGIGRWFDKSNRFKRLIGLILCTIYLIFVRKGTLVLNSAASWQFLVPTFIFRRQPFYWYIHESIPPFGLIQSKLGRKVTNYLNSKKKIRFLFGSNDTRTIWSRQDFKGLTCYWSGLSATFPKKLEFIPAEGKYSILSVGSASPRKGTFTLISSFIRGLRTGRIPPYATLTVVGFTNETLSNYSMDIFHMVAVSGFNEKIRLLESVGAEELNSFYSEADLYIQSSVMECLPLSLLQAMAMQIPCISTNVNGCSEAIHDGHTGILCDARSPESMLNAIEFAILNETLMGNYALNARKSFKSKFSLRVTQKILWDILEKEV